jgi:hypothetical protein
MSCAILTPEGIDRLLVGTLSAEEQHPLLEHLSSPCEECLELLAGPAGDVLLERLAGDGLTQAESDRIFAAALAPPARRRSRWMTPNTVGAAIAASVALIGIWGSIPRHQPELVDQPTGQVSFEQTGSGTRLKGTAGRPSAVLIALAGKPGDRSSIHLLPPKANLAKGEVLLLRMRISASFAYLIGFGDEPPARLFWPGPGEEAQARKAGEYELTRGDAALSIDVRALGRAPFLALITSPEPLAVERLERLPRGAKEIAEALPCCGVDVLQPRIDP